MQSMNYNKHKYTQGAKILGCYATKSSRPDQGAPVDVEGILLRP